MSSVPAGTGGATTLLLIDDDPQVLAATTHLLTQAGYQVIRGATATEAVNLTYKHKPAIVLLDVMLPDGNGLEVSGPPRCLRCPALEVQDLVGRSGVGSLHGSG